MLSPYQTVHRTFQKWRAAGVFRNIAKVLGEKLFELGKIKTQETFIYGSFAHAKKEGERLGRPKKVRTQK